jgi:hypothetical protein
MSGTLDIAGTRFAIPASVLGVEPGEGRQVVGIIPAAPVEFGSDLMTYDLSAEAGDLTAVQTGRAPLLMEHGFRFDNLLGALTAAWFDAGPMLCVTARLARTPDADRVLAFIRDGLPLSISVGADIVEAELIETMSDGRRHIKAVRWRLREVSLVVYGRNPHAALHDIESAIGQGLLTRRADGGAAYARRDAEKRLALDRWRAWAYGASLRLADELGCDAARVTELLTAEVVGHGARLLDDLAA